jgi:hypothetical protein
VLFRSLAERAQTSREKQAGESLAWSKENATQNLALEKWHQEQLMSQAAKGDTKTGISNVIGTLGSLGNMYLLNKYGYLKR